jgi:hypothetical protein
MTFALTLLVYVIILFIASLEAIVIYRLLVPRETGGIDLSWLLAADDGRASSSRLQLMLFAFVIAGGFAYLTVKGGAFPVIDQSVLTLLGISSANYALAKAIDNQTPTPKPPSGPTPPGAPPPGPQGP